MYETVFFVLFKKQFLNCRWQRFDPFEWEISKLFSIWRTMDNENMNAVLQILNCMNSTNKWMKWMNVGCASFLFHLIGCYEISCKLNAVRKIDENEKKMIFFCFDVGVEPVFGDLLCFDFPLRHVDRIHGRNLRAIESHPMHWYYWSNVLHAPEGLKTM